MKIELYHKYSELDKEHQFCIFTLGEHNWDTNYINWVWYYLGWNFGLHKPTIYPFQPIHLGVNGDEFKLIKSYKFCNDAKRQASMIAIRITKLNTASKEKK